MSLKKQIEDDIKKAMLAREKDTLTALREIKSLILLEETKGGQVGELNADDEVKILNRLIKQRKESYEMFSSQNRATQAEEQKAVIQVMERYLPAQMSDEELKTNVEALVKQLDVKSADQAGKVIGMAIKSLAGKVDGQRVSEMVKKVLSSL